MIAWPERVIGLLLLTELIILVLFVLTSPTAGSTQWFFAIGWLWRFPAFSLIPLWLIFRAIDLLFAGPARRRGYLTAHLLP